MSAPTANELYHAAQALIRQGQPVFPCQTHGKKAKAPLTKQGLHDASLDRDQVKAWIKRWGGDVALGIPTGIVWDVLDVDVKKNSDGRVHLPSLIRLGLVNGCKKVTRSPSGGWHLYFRSAPLDNTNKAHAGLGLDVRAKGGYVLAAPSFIDDGEASVGNYEEVGETTGSTDEPLRWGLILNALAPVDETTRHPIDLLPSERRASVASLREWLSIRMAGERNNALHWAVCRCIESGIDPHELVDVALLIGLDEDEVNLTISSAIRRSGLDASDLVSEVEALFPEDVD